ncbi:MAG: DUF4147 domain-containing protein, partial [Candidatus Kerfeldbacteria bacterium]|nr:DUF4147 domain-containing protein [Candidatus Kerfeldbacteria bacterium]
RGANITALNTVRKHLSQVKGGQLAANTKAAVVSLIISDVIGDQLDVVASGLTVVDPSTSRHAVAILRKHGLYTPQLHQVMSAETPKGGLKHVRNVLIGSNNLALEQLTVTALQHGIQPHILTTTLHGEARVAARKLVQSSHRHRRRPALLLAGGETTVTVRGKGYGGRNQELALAAMKYIKPGMTLLALATDGVDGHTPRPVAGAFTKQPPLPLDIDHYLKHNDSYTALRKLGCLLHTGPTGTNVGDIIMILVEK